MIGSKFELSLLPFFYFNFYSESFKINTPFFLNDVFFYPKFRIDKLL